MSFILQKNSFTFKSKWDRIDPRRILFMSTQLEKTIRETFGDLDNLTPEAVHNLIQDALQTFIALGQKSQSTDPKERDEALKIALSLKETLETQTEELAKASGIDSESLTQLAENEALFTSETWNELKDAKQELEALRHNLASSSKKTASHPKKKKATRINA